MKHLVGYLIGYPCIIEITLSICGRKTAKFLWCFIQSRFYCHFDCITGRNESTVWRPFAIAMYNNLNHFRNEVNTADWICFVAGFYRSANPSASFSVSIPVDVIHHTKPRPDAIFMRLQWPRQIGMLLKKKKNTPHGSSESVRSYRMHRSNLFILWHWCRLWIEWIAETIFGFRHGEEFTAFNFTRPPPTFTKQTLTRICGLCIN